MGVTRTDIRRAVGDYTGELMVLRASTASPSTDTLTDNVHLADRDDNAVSLMNRILYFPPASYGGRPENAGLECRTQAYSSSAHTLTFTPAVQLEPQPGDEVELWSNWTRFGSIGALHREIANAINAVGNLIGPEAYTTSSTFDRAVPEIAIPETWAEYGGAERRDHNDTRWKDVGEQWQKVRPSERTVELRGRAARLNHTYGVRLFGYARVTAPDDDTTETDVDLEWIVSSIAKGLRLGSSWRASDRASEERMSQFWANEALDYRRKLSRPRRGMRVRLP